MHNYQAYWGGNQLLSVSTKYFPSIPQNFENRKAYWLYFVSGFVTKLQETPLKTSHTENQPLSAIHYGKIRLHQIEIPSATIT